SFYYDARHDLDRFARVLARCGFAGEHYRVGPVKDRIRDVTGFGACGARVLDHRLEHLGRSNHRFSPRGRAPDYVLLNDWNLFRGHLNAEIAAGDHGCVGSFENFFQMVDGLRFFELGDYWDVVLV